MTSKCVDFEVRQNIHFDATFTLTQEDGTTPFDLTGFVINMHLRHGGIFADLTTVNGRIQIVDAAAGQIKFFALDTWLTTIPSATYQHQLFAAKTGSKPEIWTGSFKLLPGIEL